MHIERHRTKATRLIHDGLEVGTVFRFTGSRGYGIHMPGIYWRRRQPTRHGGSATVGVERMKDALDVASRAIPLLPPNYCSAAKNDIATPPNPAPKTSNNAE